MARELNIAPSDPRLRAQHRQNQELLRQIRENAYSDRPVWDVRLDTDKIRRAAQNNNDNADANSKR